VKELNIYLFFYLFGVLSYEKKSSTDSDGQQFPANIKCMFLIFGVYISLVYNVY
jgi:hypothetical protein